MSVSPAFLQALRDAGVSDTQIVDALLAAGDERLAQGRERVAKHRKSQREANAGNVTSVTSVTPPTPPPSKEKSPTPPKETQPSPLPQKSRELALDLPDPFDEFWKVYPNKVGKPDAKKAWGRATQRSSYAAILAGVTRYIATKPADRPWCNPSTFLNQDRWADEPAPLNGQTGPPKRRTDAYGQPI